MPSRYDLSRDALAELLAGEPPFRVRQVWDGLHRRVAEPEEQTDLPAGLRRRLAAEPAFAPALREELQSTSDNGDTVKWLWSLADGARIETVLMHYPARPSPRSGGEFAPSSARTPHQNEQGGRSTVCVSTQAGCAMACGFCATGQAGFERNLSTGEIVEQVARAIRAARPRRVSNVVFMGMGEPFANYDRVWAAVRRLHDDVGISARHLTLSTVGIVPGIRRLATEDLPVNLAVSLHAADDELRDTLVPINRRYPLAELVSACGEYLAAKGRRLSFEWALIDGVNDRRVDVDRLAALARSLGAHVNLIPLNPTPGYPTPGTPPSRVRAFRDRLRELGVNVTVRRNRGTDIDAACGQLSSALRPTAVRPTDVRLTGGVPLPD